MKVAVVGAGLAGLATAWHLLDQSKATLSLDIFDPLPLGEGTSGLASGLLHPYTGVRAQLNWKGHRMMEEAHNLLTAASPYASGPLVLSTGILRVALSSPQIAAFKECASKHKDCLWMKRDEALKYIPQLSLSEESGALLFTRGVTVNVKHYIQALMQTILRLGGQWHQTEITDPSIFADYDRVVIAMGPATLGLNALANLPLSKIKGQSLELRWPTNLVPLPMSIMGETHIVMRPDYKSCLIGATFERDYLDPKPDLEYAKKALLTKTTTLLPGLADAEVIGSACGVRACPATHKPLLGRLNERFWFFTGLCAKGLLYHGYLGQKLAKALLAENPALLPPEVLHTVHL